MPADSAALATRSLMLMTTYRCQLRCSYCGVRRGRGSMPAAIARRAADYLLSSRAERLLLNFFGGEPLLEWRLVRGAALYARQRRAGRPLRVNLTTNGLLLDSEKLDFLAANDGYVHLSLDGPPGENAARLRGAPPGAQAALEAALRRLERSGVPYHVNAVVEPSRAAAFDEDLRALEALGARRIQFGYRVGAPWGPRELAALRAALDRYEARAGAELLNRRSDSEPVMLSREPLVDGDGSIYWDGAVFLERPWPRLREALRLGHLDDPPPIDGLRSSAPRPYERLAAAYPACTAEGRLILNNIKAGLELRRHWLGGAAASFGAEDPEVRRGIVEADLPGQDRFLRRRMPWLDRVFLFVRGGCDLDCLFCRRKEGGAPQSLDEIDAFLAANAALERRRIALVGNEPLAHPRAVEVVRLCRARGFSDVQIMTSGLRLAGLARPLAEAGASSYAVALHGSSARVHDAVTRRPGSFEAALEGLRAAQAAGARLFVHANACRRNMADLPALERLAAARGWSFSIHPLRPKGPGGMNVPYEQAAPRYAELRRALAGRVRSLTGFPACVARRIQDASSCAGTDVADAMKLYLLHQEFVKPEGCRACPDAVRCVGTFAEHLARRPADAAELAPRGAS